MDPKMLYLVVIASLVLLTCGQQTEKEEPQPMPTIPPTTQAPPNTTTTTVHPFPEPTNTTTKPTTKPTSTTPPTTSTSTTPPTTSTSTTPSTTTTSHTTPSTVPTTSSPTTPATTTTPRPSPKPETGKWSVTDNKTNVTCILVDMAIQLNISYLAKDNKIHHGIMDVPKIANATGTCGNDTQLFNLTWFNKDNTTNKLDLVFANNETTNRFMIVGINVTITPTNEEIFPNIKDMNVTVLYSNKTEFSTPVSKSYRCSKEQTFELVLVNVVNATNATVVNGTYDITLSNVQLEAFHKTKDTNFGAVEDCEPSSSPDIVPIAVGCALVGLVAIVLVAYLVGRRRSQARGYLSM